MHPPTHTPPFSASVSHTHPSENPTSPSSNFHLPSTVLPSTPIPHFLETDLSVPRLLAITHLLILAGRPSAPRPLHKQQMMRRQLVLTESADLHLTWQNTTLFLKPLPRYLLSHAFWATYLCSSTALYRDACGLLRSYAHLICYESDFELARAARLVPSDMAWGQWRALALEVRGNVGPGDVCLRYRFGELRLNRLNLIYRFTGRNVIRGYYYDYRTYQEFFGSNLAWIVVVFLYITVVLAAMQVGLGTERLNSDKRFQNAAAGFAVFAILGPVVIVGLAACVFLFLVVYNLYATIEALRKEKGERGEAYVVKR